MTHDVPAPARAVPGLLLLGSLMLAAGCGGGGGSGGGSLQLLSCSLGCTGSGGQMGCGVTDVYVNQEIRLRFSSPIAIGSVNNLTFQVTEVSTGKSPAATFSLDPNDPKVLIYRPQLTFDSAGNPIFGLTANSTYTFLVPGQALDPIGPYIKSKGGSSNQTRLLCTLEATRGVFDPNPGPPTASVLVDLVTSYDENGDPQDIAFDQPAQNAVNVWRSSDILFRFDDVMNPATLVNPVTGVSNTILVRIDPDGDLTDTTDQVPLQGTFSISIDQDALTTTVVFTPDGGMPSAGTQPGVLRKVVVTLPTTIKDLGGNSLTNSGRTSFTPEVIQFDPTQVVEDFSNNSREDSTRTGSDWATDGMLASGVASKSGILGGGSGRLGDLTVPTGMTVTLDTDMEDFTADVFSDPEVYNPALIIDPDIPGEPNVVVGGVFEFSSLTVEAGGTLAFQGSNPARLLVRGEAIVQGEIDLSGEAPPDHDSLDFVGGVTGTAGPGAGVGGQGGDRPDGENLASAGGTDNPNDPVLYEDVDGKPGVGIPFPDSMTATDLVAEGLGGLAWPQPTSIDPTLHFPADVTDVAGTQVEKRIRCENRAPGGVGGGGAYALDGGDGKWVQLLPNDIFNTDPLTPPPGDVGGLSSELGIDDTVRTLDPELGLLRGGSGGGGGGAHIQQSQINGEFFVDCQTPTFPDTVLKFVVYKTSSSAGGGGGGGALQFQAGRRIVLNGIVDTSGGDGGSVDSTVGSLAQAGGGGSGGALLLQAPSTQIQNVPGRIDDRGGDGGLGVNGSLGGDGSPGLVRIETFQPLLDLDTVAGAVLPDITELSSTFGVGPEAILSIDEWVPTMTGPGALSGAESCWLRPSGNFFLLQFDEDDPIAGTLGWDMRLNIDGFPNPQSYRGSNDLFSDSLEHVFGNQLGSAPVVVRFQGARAIGVLPDPCNVQLTGPGSPLQQGTLTGWVEQPSDLNAFFSGDISKQPNLVRFVVIWDASQATFAGIRGIEDITIGVQPD